MKTPKQWLKDEYYDPETGDWIGYDANKAMQGYAEYYHQEKMTQMNNDAIRALEHASAKAGKKEPDINQPFFGNSGAKPEHSEAWICPRCGKVHSYLSLTCDCPPNTITSTTYDETYINECIEKAKLNLSKIKDVDVALDEIRGIDKTAEEVLAKHSEQYIEVMRFDPDAVGVSFRQAIAAMEEYAARKPVVKMPSDKDIIAFEKLCDIDVAEASMNEKIKSEIPEHDTKSNNHQIRKWIKK